MPSERERNGSSNNAIIAKLPAHEFRRLESLLQPVDLEVKKVLQEPGRPIQHAYLLEEGMISLVSVMGDGRSIEVGNVGREGIVGGTILLASDGINYRHVVQSAARGWRISAESLLAVAEQCPELRKLILQYLAAFLTETMQGMACNGLHSVQQRCCRWLLMGRDRLGSDDLAITHEVLALMLGVRRASVSEVLRPLQQRGLVRYSRGRITILDLPGLEAGACECYRVIADRYNDILC